MLTKADGCHSLGGFTGDCSIFQIEVDAFSLIQEVGVAVLNGPDRISIIKLETLIQPGAGDRDKGSLF
jgi:hypothetical protein